MIDIEHGRVLEYARFDGMNELPIRDRLVEALGVPVHIHNNTSVIALGEYRYGRARGVRSLAAFLLRYGVGGAYISDGRIVESRGRSVFEIGHLYPDLSSLDSNSRETVLEDYLGEQSLLAHVTAAVPAIDGWAGVVEALGRGDRAVIEALRPRADILAAAARNIALLVSPEAFLIVTRFTALSEYFARSVEARFAAVPDSIRLGVQRVIPVAYDSLLSARGAAALVFEQYFDGTSGYAE